MLALLFAQLLGMVWPGVPAWVAPLLAELVPAVVRLVAKLDDREDLPGADRAERAVREVGAFLDARLDKFPEWRELSEEQRDRILLGLVELALFVHKAAGGRGSRKVREALRR